MISVSQIYAETVPVDTVITWFNSYCDQTKQVKAFYTIAIPVRETGVSYTGNSVCYCPYRMLGVKAIYDTSSVKDAFKKLRSFHNNR